MEKRGEMTERRDQESRQTDIYTRRLEEWLEYVEGENALAVERFLADKDHRERLARAPGSRSAHHAWEGGYHEHLRQTMMIIAHNMELFERTGRMSELPEDERFTLSDALVVMFLHDIEKPFVYGIDEQGAIVTVVPMPKADRKRFRADVIDHYGFRLTPTMANALMYVEGERDVDYIPGGRAEQPLASLCQVADNQSARAFHDHRG